MRRKYSKILQGNYISKEISYKNIFLGKVNCIIFENVEVPSYVNTNVFKVCIKNNNYVWFEIYPKNDNYVLTIMFDDKNNIIQWYFDISKYVNVDESISYQDDLYLDLVITFNKNIYVLDETELNNALNKNIITKEDFNLAYKILNKLKKFM